MCLVDLSRLLRGCCEIKTTEKSAVNFSWVVERSIAWLHSYRRLKMRYEKLAMTHEAFLSLACSLICWNFLKPLI
ncbi:transposase [Undibacterium sp. Di27W]|uniref:transposase n=1 Tax=Undibacterium sp. Di27W TaxID=3413036 RepID=UPI003BF4431D